MLLATVAANNIIGGQHLFIKAFDTLLWRGEQLVLFILDLPVDFVLTAIANAVVFQAIDDLDLAAGVVQIVLEGRFVLVLGRFELVYVSSLS